MKRKYYIGMLLAASYLLSGCGIYNRYSRPETDINTDSLYRMPVQSADSTTMATKLWRELFTDPHLQTLITTGLKRNTDLNIARLQIEESQAILTNARLSYLPSVSLTPQAGVSRYNGETKKHIT